MAALQPWMHSGSAALGGLAIAGVVLVELIPADATRAREAATRFRCRFCGSRRATPLLDSSRRFLGEVACLTCGELNHVPPPTASGGPRPGPSRG